MSPMAPARVPVSLPGRSYDILVGPGLLAQAGRHIPALGSFRRVAIVTDRHVAPHHLEPLRASLTATGLDCPTFILEPGEQTKSWPVLGTLLDGLLAASIERGDAVLALGGGVIGDLAGLAASLLRRGVSFIQCPTTLLAQVDSAVGGKTGIDTAHGKNLIGTFHQPRLALADTATLATLPARELRAGYAEVVKYGLIADAPFFAWCEQSGAKLLAGDEAARQHAVVTSCTAKARIVVADERETGERALLNLGHTFGHAFETAAGHGARLVHGEAVAIGMACAFDLSAKLGIAPEADAARVRRHLKAVGLPTALADIMRPALSLDAVMTHMMQDKKIVGGALTLVLARGIGQAFLTRAVDAATVRAFLADREAAAA